MRPRERIDNIMKNIVNFVKSRKFGHALGTFLVLAFIFTMYFIGSSMEYHTTFGH